MEQRLRFLAAVSTGLCLTIAAYVLAHTQGYDKGWKLITLAITVNLASSIIGYTCVSWVTDKESDDDRRSFADETIVQPLLGSIGSLVQVRGNADTVDLTTQLSELRAAIRDFQGATVLEKINWESLIGGASEIDFVVQGWDGWFERYESAIRLFMQRGGRFRLYTYDPVSAKSEQARALMGERLGKPPHEVISEITNTVKTVQAIRDGLPPDKNTVNNLEIVLMTEINWYFAAKFIGAVTSASSRNRDALVFSVYSHTPQRPYNMPALTLDPGVHPVMSNWFDGELAHLRGLR